MSNILSGNKIIKTVLTPVQIGPLSSLKISEMFKDGRYFSPLGEEIIPLIFTDYIKNKSTTKKEYDGIIAGKFRTEVRTLTKNGLNTCPSYMIGASRTYNQKEHSEVLDRNDYYIVMDSSDFPNITIYVLLSTQELLFRNKSYKGAIKLLNKLCQGATIENILL